MSDAWLMKAINDLDKEIVDCHMALERQPFTDLMQVGILQGRIQGYREARKIIEQAIREPEDD